MGYNVEMAWNEICLDRITSNMNRLVERAACGLVHRFAQSGMGVDAGFDVVVRRFKREGQPQFCNHLRRLRTNNVRAEQFAVRFAENEFNEAVYFTDSAGLATGAERKSPDPEFQTLFRRSPLG